jgi:hypothetical protein
VFPHFEASPAQVDILRDTESVPGAALNIRLVRGGILKRQVLYRSPSRL